jgi:sugar diacid utilization regulator
VSAAKSASGTADHGGDSAVRAIALRIAAQREPLARRITDRQREQAEEAGEREDPVSAEESFYLALVLIDGFVASLHGAEPMSPAVVERMREMAARRAHQRVPLESFTRRPRVWGEVVWEAVVATARVSKPHERDAAIQISSMLMRYVDLISRAATSAYLDEITDRGLLRRDLLDALISGRGEEDGVRKLARSLRLKLADSYIAVIVRGEDMHGETGRDEPLPGRVALDRIVEATRRYMQPTEGSLLAGMRQGDLVALYPVSGPSDMQIVRDDCAELANALPVEVSIGISASHRGLREVATAYAEAREAVEVADRLNIRGRAVGLEDLLVDHMLRASGHAQRILLDAMQRLVDYDKQHGTELVATLRTYVDTGFNLTKSGSLLFVHPNTVVYRLRRIHELSGHDPHDVDDLLVLWLGLKVLDLRAREAL